MKVCCIISHENAVALGKSLGALVCRFSKKKFSKATERCSRILNVSEERASEIVNNSYMHFGGAAAEFARMPVMADKLDSIVNCDHFEYLEEGVKSGRGVLLITAHLGNWEYAGAYIAQRGLPVNGVGADQRDERITNMIMKLRAAGGMKALGKARDLRVMVAALKKGEIIAIPVDQDAKLAGVLSPFLGHPASTPVGPAKLAGKLNCDVIVAVCVRAADGIHYDLIVNPPLKGRDGLPFGKDIQTSTDDMNGQLSKLIRDYPDQWMWMYPRWESVERGLFEKVK